MHEWALLILTICIPTAIGGLLFLTLIHKKIVKMGLDPYKIMKLPFLVFAGLSVIGLGASFLHLGTPTHALYTIMGIGRSWMSNEIVFTGAFIGLTCLTAGLAILQKKTNPKLMLLTGIVGLIDVYCMGKIYANTLVSGWDALNTFTSFYGTVLVLGPILAASLIAPRLRAEGNEDTGKGFVKTAFLLALAGIAVQAVGVSLFGTTIPEVNMISGTNAMTTLDGYQNTVMMRWIIEIIGVGVLGYLSLAKTKLSLSIGYVGFVLVLVAEGMSRYVFYVLGS
jgi:anaerobic dimethyl sulfoxide reductase subunit C (anchor subunit)